MEIGSYEFCCFNLASIRWLIAENILIEVKLIKLNKFKIKISDQFFFWLRKIFSKKWNLFFVKMIILD